MHCNKNNLIWQDTCKYSSFYYLIIYVFYIKVVIYKEKNMKIDNDKFFSSSNILFRVPKMFSITLILFDVMILKNIVLIFKIYAMRSGK